MAKKCNCPPEGAPLWVLTYGDMMSLLLTFFILLVAMSEIKKEDQFRAVVESVQRAFGMKGGGAKLPTIEDPDTSLLKILDEIQLQQRRKKHQSEADDPGIEGRQVKVTRVREDLKFVVGGYITFESGSADLGERAREHLLKVSRLLAGHRNKIELRGHTATAELVDLEKFSDLRDLGYARAKAVEDFLVTRCRIKPERIRLISSSDREPLRKAVYTEHQLQPNRRVEILVSEALVDEFTKPD